MHCFTNNITAKFGRKSTEVAFYLAMDVPCIKSSVNWTSNQGFKL